MEYDPLAAFRKNPAPPKGGGTEASDEDKYTAFGTKDKVRRLRIRSRKYEVNSPGYNILLNVIYDAPQGTFCILVYSILQVNVKGRNLQKLVWAIENDMADFIQEFDPKQWSEPKDLTAPFIDSIEMRIVKNGKPTEEKEL